MTDTDVIGKIVTNDGKLHQIFQTVTDNTPEAMTIYDLSGAAKNLYEYLLGKVVIFMQLQASDGSILAYVQVTQNGAETHRFLGGERLTASDHRANLETSCYIPILETTRINLDTDD